MAWFDCYRNVATKFTELKKKARKFYENLTDREVLIELQKYSPQDLKDMIDD